MVTRTSSLVPVRQRYEALAYEAVAPNLLIVVASEMRTTLQLLVEPPKLKSPTDGRGC